MNQRMHFNNVSNRGRFSKVQLIAERKGREGEGRKEEKWCLFLTTTSHKTNNDNNKRERRRKELSEKGEGNEMEEIEGEKVSEERREGRKNIRSNTWGWMLLKLSRSDFFQFGTISKWDSHLKFKFRMQMTCIHPSSHSFSLSSISLFTSSHNPLSISMSPSLSLFFPLHPLHFPLLRWSNSLGWLS